MISSNKPLEPQNTLMRRIQRYAQVSTIFRTTDTAGEATNSRATNEPVKAILLSGPANLPVGQTAVSQNFGQSFGNVSALPESALNPVSAAIEQATQMQRSPDSQLFSSDQTISAQMPSAVPPVMQTMPSSPSANVVQAAPTPENTTNDSEWNRLQRIIKGHETKKEPGATSQPTQVAPSPVQKAESPFGTSADPIQRAVAAAESSQSSVSPKKAPLESMWPVQQIEPQAVVQNDEPIVMPQPDTPVSTESAQSPAQAETIRRKLEDVSVTRPSDSSVELHLPRRPRPAIQAKPAKEDANTSFWNRMREMEGKAPEAVQRTVDTEIGPLPADMWEILGETPPGAADSNPAEIIESTAPILAPGTAETAVPSFLARPLAQTASDSVQRAIAAAETPEISTETAKTDTSPVVQRQEAATSVLPAAIQSEPGTPSAAVLPESPTPSSLSIEPTIQRTTTYPTESEAVVAPNAVPNLTNQNASPADSPAGQTTEPGLTQAALLQRAIHAAETPTTSKPEAPPPAAASTPSIMPTLPTANPVQAMPNDSTSQASAQTSSPTILPGTTPLKPAAVDTDVADDGAGADDSIQRDVTNPSLASSALTGANLTAAVDLNAETAPLPEMTDIIETPALSRDEVAVFPSSQTPDSLQRAIAAAEAPASAVESAPAKPASTTAVPNIAAPIIQMKRAADPVASPKTITPTSNLETTSPKTPQTAVPQAAPTTAETIQRAIAAAEPTPESTATFAQPAETAAQTAVPQTVQPSAAETVQRAIAAAESAPQSIATFAQPAETAAQTAVPQTVQPSATETVQRAIAAAESTPQSIATFAQPAETARTVTQTVTQATPTTAETVQRAIAAAESAPQSTATFAQPAETAAQTAVPQTVQPSAAETVQRAIAAAESTFQSNAPFAQPAETAGTVTQTVTQATPTTAETVQRAIAVAESNAPFAQPAETTGPAAQTAVLQTVQPSATESVQRAIAAAESTVTFPQSAETTGTIPQTVFQATPSTAETVQRAITAAESAHTNSPFTIHNSQFTIRNSLPTDSAIATAESTTPFAQPAETAGTSTQTAVPQAVQPSAAETIQRAIAAAEMSPTLKSTMPVLQRTPTNATQTAVTPLAQRTQTSNWQSQQETARQTPITTQSPSTPTTLMRTLATTETIAETTTKPTPGIYQWPDINPAAAAQIQNNIQRAQVPVAGNEINMEHETASAENPAEIDIDQLANAVYSQLRKRLAIEWERGRGKR